MASEPHRQDSTFNVNNTIDDDPFYSEESPFLQNDLPQDVIPTKSFRRRVVAMCVVSLFIVEMSIFVMDAPTQKIMEDIICRNYYPDHLLRTPRAQDDRCKNSEVQSTLAMVKGWFLAAEAATPIFAQIPFGIIADKYGRRLVLFVALFGLTLKTAWSMLVLYFPNIFSIWAMIAGNVFNLIGGGGQMAVAMVYTIVADVVPIAERTAVFYNIIALLLVLQLVVNPISAFIMSFDPWFAMWLGFAFFVAGTASTLLIPETLTLRKKADDRQRHSREHSGSSEALRQNGKNAGIPSTVWSTVQNDMVHVWRFIFATKTIALLLAAYSISVVARVAMSNVLLQYMTKRFNWEWSKATYVSTIGILANIVAVLIILPLISLYLTKRRGMSPMQRDLRLAWASSISVVMGTFLMAIAPAPWTFVAGIVMTNLGQGFMALCRALMMAIVEPHTIALLNTTISLSELIIGSVGSPTLAWLLSKGIQLGGAWSGLPFLAVCGCTIGGTAMLIAFKPPVNVAEREDDE